MAVRSCTLPVSAVGNQEITTIEGLSESGDHPVQKAWIEHDVYQCGYCQAGQIMQASAFLNNNPNPSDEETEAKQNVRTHIVCVCVFVCACVCVTPFLCYFGLQLES